MVGSVKRSVDGANWSAHAVPERSTGPSSSRALEASKTMSAVGGGIDGKQQRYAAEGSRSWRRDGFSYVMRR